MGENLGQDPALESDPWWGLWGSGLWGSRQAPPPTVTAAPPPGNAAEERRLLFEFFHPESVSARLIFYNKVRMVVHFSALSIYPALTRLPIFLMV